MAETAEPMIFPIEVDDKQILETMRRADELAEKLRVKLTDSFESATNAGDKATAALLGRMIKNADKLAAAELKAAENAAKKAAAAKLAAQKKAASESAQYWNGIGGAFIGGFSGGASVIIAENLFKVFSGGIGAIKDAGAAAFDFFSTTGTKATELNERLGKASELWVPPATLERVTRLESAFGGALDAGTRLGIEISASIAPVATKLLTTFIAITLAITDAWKHYADGVKDVKAEVAKFIIAGMFPLLTSTNDALKGWLALRRAVFGQAPGDSALQAMSTLLDASVKSLEIIVTKSLTGVEKGWEKADSALGSYMDKAEALIKQEQTAKFATPPKPPKFTAVSFEEEDSELANINKLQTAIASLYLELEKPRKFGSLEDLNQYVKEAQQKIGSLQQDVADDGFLAKYVKKTESALGDLWVNQMQRLAKFPDKWGEQWDKVAEDIDAAFKKLALDQAVQGAEAMSTITGAASTGIESVAMLVESSGTAQKGTIEAVWGVAKGFAIANTLAQGAVAVMTALAQGGPFAGVSIAAGILATAGALAGQIAAMSGSGSDSLTMPGQDWAKDGGELKIKEGEAIKGSGKNSSDEAIKRTTGGGGGSVWRGRSLDRVLSDMIDDSADWTRKVTGGRVGRGSAYGRG